MFSSFVFRKSSKLSTPIPIKNRNSSELRFFVLGLPQALAWARWALFWARWARLPPPLPALNLILPHIVAKIRRRPALNSIFGHIVAKIRRWPALHSILGHIVAKIRRRPALNLIFGHIVAKIRRRPALNSILPHIVAKSRRWKTCIFWRRLLYLRT